MKISLKFRITALFTAMILILTGLILTIVFIVADKALTDDPIESLVQTVNMNAVRLERDNDKHKFDDFEAYHEGVYCQLFSADGDLICGTAPDGLDFSDDFLEGSVVTHTSPVGDFYIYDVQVKAGKWIRGYILTDEPSETTKIILLSVIIIVPIIAAVSISGGYFITKRSLKPLDKIIETAESINNGDDLEKRIGNTNGATELQKLSDQLDRMIERLQCAFEAERQFASDAAHEFRTPLTIMLGECHRLQAVVEHESVASIEKQCNLLSQIVDTLLTLTRLQQRNEDITFKKTNISDFLMACVEEYADEHHVVLNDTSDAKTIKTDIPEGIFAEYNPDLMSRVLYNLLTNARKYTNENGAIFVSLTEENESAVITVADNGIGIAPEDLNKIWTRFWQADQSRSVDNGVGLGLPLVKEMVAFQGGTIVAQSKLGEGSRFIIKLNR